MTKQGILGRKLSTFWTKPLDGDLRLYYKIHIYILHFIIRNRTTLSILSAYFKIFLVSFKWVKTGVVSYFSTEGKHFRRQTRIDIWHSIGLLMTSSNGSIVNIEYFPLVSVVSIKVLQIDVAMDCLSFCYGLCFTSLTQNLLYKDSHWFCSYLKHKKVQNPAFRKLSTALLSTNENWIYCNISCKDYEDLTARCRNETSVFVVVCYFMKIFWKVPIMFR